MNDTSIDIPKLHFDGNGALAITASPTSSQDDFDFFVGQWKILNKKLQSRLTRQAYSADRGETWEWNWFMYMRK